MDHPTFKTDRRSTPPRDPLDGEVVVEVEASRIVGPGQNISEEGVFFIAEGELPVKVRIEGRDGVRIGELVRLESMGGGRLGVAVRFAK